MLVYKRVFHTIPYITGRFVPIQFRPRGPLQIMNSYSRCAAQSAVIQLTWVTQKQSHILWFLMYVLYIYIDIHMDIDMDMDLDMDIDMQVSLVMGGGTPN